MDEVIIYTDGACSGNPGKGGWGAVLIYGKVQKEISGAAKETTNNQMELTAPIEALKLLKRPCRVTLYSDSAYLINAFQNGWLEKWRNNGWKTAGKQEVKNKELWMEIDRLAQIHQIEWIKVKGHSDNVYNNRCDELATTAIKKLET